MYVSIIILILIGVYHVVKIRYSAFCAAVYKIFCDRRNNPDLFLENNVSDCMFKVLSDDVNYKETILVLKINKILNIKPFVYFENESSQILEEINPNVKKVLNRFKIEFKDVL